MLNAEDEKGVFSRVQTGGGALLEGSGRPLMQVATEVGISPSMLRNWRAAVHGGTARSRATASITRRAVAGGSGLQIPLRSVKTTGRAWSATC